MVNQDRGKVYSKEIFHALVQESSVNDGWYLLQPVIECMLTSRTIEVPTIVAGEYHTHHHTKWNVDPIDAVKLLSNANDFVDTEAERVRKLYRNREVGMEKLDRVEGRNYRLFRNYANHLLDLGIFSSMKAFGEAIANIVPVVNPGQLLTLLILWIERSGLENKRVEGDVANLLYSKILALSPSSAGADEKDVATLELINELMDTLNVEKIELSEPIDPIVVNNAKRFIQFLTRFFDSSFSSYHHHQDRLIHTTIRTLRILLKSPAYAHVFTPFISKFLDSYPDIKRALVEYQKMIEIEEAEVAAYVARLTGIREPATTTRL